DDPGEDGRDLDRRLAIREREPAVEREQGCLDRESDGEPEEDPGVVTRPRVDQAERALRYAEGDDRGENEQRADHRVDDEGEGGRGPVLAAPDADEAVDREHHGLEGD